MKKLKRNLAMLLAMIMLMTAVMVIPAAANEPTGTLTITAPSHVELTDLAFRAFRIFDAVRGTGTPPTVTYTFNTAFSGFLNEFTPAKTGFELLEYVRDLEGNEVAEFAAKFFEWADDNNIAPSATAIGAGNIARFSNIPFGYYLVSGFANNTTDDGNPVPTFPSLWTLVDGTRDVVIKADLPFITKDAPGSVDFGDTVWFELRSLIPNVTGFDTYTYIIRDRMTNLILNADSFEMHIVDNHNSAISNDTRITFNPDWLTLHPATGAATGFDINLNIIANFSNQAGRFFVIRYSAELTEGALVNGANNSVTLEYSNDPTNQTRTVTTPPVDVHVFLFEFELFKFHGDLEDAVEEGNVLADAVFEISRGGNAIRLFQVDDGLYRVATEDEIDDEEYVTFFTTVDDGMVRVMGLAAGVYSVVETVAPAGFNLLEDPIALTITNLYDAEVNDGIRRFAVNGILFGYEEHEFIDYADSSVITVLNVAGMLLPETGGIGRTIFYVTGITIMGGAAFLLIAKKSVAKKDLEV